MFYLYETIEDTKEEIRIRKSGEIIQWPEENRHKDKMIYKPLHRKL